MRIARRNLPPPGAAVTREAQGRSRTIRVDADVFRESARRAKGFDMEFDTPNALLQQYARLPPGPARNEERLRRLIAPFAQLNRRIAR